MKLLVKTILPIFVGLIIFSSFASAAQTIKNPSVTNQFGAAAFDSKNSTLSGSVSVIGISPEIQVFEKGEYTYVYYEAYTEKSSSMFLSVAKNNKWLFRSIEMFENDIYDDAIEIIVDNYIFYQDSNYDVFVRVINPENGKEVMKKQLYDYKGGTLDSKVFRQISTKGKKGIIVGSEIEKTYTIYLDGELSKPQVISDPKNIISTMYGELILTEKRDRIINANNLYSTVYNIKAKDMVYDNTGQDRMYKFGVGGSGYVYAEGKFYSISAPYKKDVTITIYDEDFKFIKTNVYKSLSPYLSVDLDNVTFKNNTIRFWEYNNFKRTNSLKFTAYVQ